MRGIPGPENRWSDLQIVSRAEPRKKRRGAQDNEGRHADMEKVELLETDDGLLSFRHLLELAHLGAQ